jgi:hypothetical protein
MVKPKMPLKIDWNYVASFFHLLFFTAGGILSSHFRKLGNDVLINRSPASCGAWNGADVNNADDLEAL